MLQEKNYTDGDDFIQITTPPGAYEIESLNIEFRRIIIDEELYTESDYPYQIKTIVSTLGSFIETSPQGPLISFVFEDSIRNLLGFNESILYKDYNPSPNPLDILSFDKIFLECDIVNGMIYKQKRSGTIHNWPITVNPG